METSAINIWIFIDLSSDLAYHWGGRIYKIPDHSVYVSDFLKDKAQTDYLCCKRNAMPGNMRVVHGKKEMVGCMPAKLAMQFVEKHLHKFVIELSQQLPSLLSPTTFLLEDLEYTPILITRVIEDENGNISPILSDEHEEWLHTQHNMRYAKPNMQIL